MNIQHLYAVFEAITVDLNFFPWLKQKKRYYWLKKFKLR